MSKSLFFGFRRGQQEPATPEHQVSTRASIAEDSLLNLANPSLSLFAVMELALATAFAPRAAK
jgi:hypothetical protein